MTLRYIIFVLTALSCSITYAERWIVVNESRTSEGLRKIYFDSDSIRQDGQFIVYKIRYELDWFNSGRVNTFDRHVIGDCGGSRRFEALTSSELNDRNFKSVFSGTQSAGDFKSEVQQPLQWMEVEG